MKIWIDNLLTGIVVFLALVVLGWGIAWLVELLLGGLE